MGVVAGLLVCDATVESGCWTAQRNIARYYHLLLTRKASDFLAISHNNIVLFTSSSSCACLCFMMKLNQQRHLQTCEQRGL